MGLIRAIVGAAGGTMADQWIDFITCDSMPETVLMRPGTRPQQRRSANTRGTENIITDGSKINVADGQCMIIVENGKIVDFCAEPGQYTYNNTIMPSLMNGGLKSLDATFSQIGQRFKSGGAPTSQQRVYYINTKEIIGNKIGWGNIPFRDSEFQMTVRVQGFGQYSFRITNPLLFYTNVAGNTTGEFRRDDLTSQMKAEVISAMQPALGKIAQQQVAYDMLTNYPRELGAALNSEMSAEWSERRGIEIVSLAIESIAVDEQSQKKIEQLQEARALSNPMMAAGRLVAGQATAMESAAANTAGAAQAFMGMGMAQNAGGMNAGSLFQMNAQQQAPPPPSPLPTPPQMPPMSDQEQVKGNWTCASCDTVNTGNFCMECGIPKPSTEPAGCPSCGWTASNLEMSPKFCPECGSKM